MPKPKQIQLNQTIEKHDVSRALNSDSRTPVRFEVRHLDSNLVFYASLAQIKFPVASVTVIMSEKRWNYSFKAGKTVGSNRLKVKKR